ncbi:hypothetical protein GEMRC1_002356 [Eukaryota sp. GEM-RC1]
MYRAKSESFSPHQTSNSINSLHSIQSIDGKTWFGGIVVLVASVGLIPFSSVSSLLLFSPVIPMPPQTSNSINSLHSIQSIDRKTWFGGAVFVASVGLIPFSSVSSLLLFSPVIPMPPQTSNSINSLHSIQSIDRKTWFGGVVLVASVGLIPFSPVSSLLLFSSVIPMPQSQWKRNLAEDGDVETNPGPRNSHDRQRLSSDVFSEKPIRRETTTTRFLPVPKSYHVRFHSRCKIYHSCLAHLMKSSGTMDNLVICTCMEHFDPAVAEFQPKDLPPPTVSPPANYIRQSYLNEILNFHYSNFPGTLPSMYKIDNYIAAKHYGTFLHDTNHHLYSINDPILQSVQKYVSELDTMRVPVIDPDFKICPIFCDFISPCRYCLLPGHFARNCTLQFTEKTSLVSMDLSVVYKNFSHDVLLNPEALLDLLLTILHFHLHTNKHTDLYDSQTNTFTLEMFGRNSDCISKATHEKEEIRNKISATYPRLVSDINYVSSLLSDDQDGDDVGDVDNFGDFVAIDDDAYKMII